MVFVNVECDHHKYIVSSQVVVTHNVLILLLRAVTETFITKRKTKITLFARPGNRPRSNKKCYFVFFCAMKVSVTATLEVLGSITKDL